jgi:hypothetical protein
MGHYHSGINAILKGVRTIEAAVTDQAGVNQAPKARVKCAQEMTNCAHNLLQTSSLFGDAIKALTVLMAAIDARKSSQIGIRIREAVNMMKDMSGRHRES